MSTRINPPVYKKEKSYELFKKEVEAWKAVTDLAKEKQGIVIALGLPEDDSLKIREKVFEEVSIEELNGEDGLGTLIAFLDRHLGTDELEDSLQKFEDFEDYKRNENETIDQYIGNFEQKYARVKAKNLVLPDPILAFKLLKRAGLSKEERLLVLTGIDYEKKDTLFAQASRSLKKFKGVGCSGSKSQSESTAKAIHVEPTYVANAYNRGSGISGARYRGYNRGNQYASGAGVFNKQGNPGRKGNDRHMNPTGPDGQPLRCRCCGSFRHFLKNCPDSWESKAAYSTKKVNFVQEEVSHVGNEELDHHVVMFTGFNKSDVSMLGIEANNSAVLDSACSSTVCGESWLDGYLDTLDEKERESVISKNSDKIFKFGGGTKLQSTGEYTIPAYLVGEKVSIRTDVVKSDIPLLLSREAMKTAKVKMDIENDSAEVLGKEVSLNLTSSGHYCIPLGKDISVKEVNAVKLDELSDTDLHKTLLKLHRSFAHPTPEKLVNFLKDAGIWDKKYREELEKIYENCSICKQFAKTPPRPVVALPMAKRFNEVVSMDLKKWNERWILHLIDLWSRYTQSVFIKRKKPSSVIDAIMQNWIGTFGVMEGVLSDNGGEFSSEESRDVASVLDLKVSTTAAESPFQNGLCERVHAVTDMMLAKLEAEYPDTSIEVLLKWANMARNSLQMWNGYSSHQLVFGQNPNLPNIMTEKLPALDGVTQSEVLAKHLNALHAGRKAFIETEADERIRRALRHKVRASEQIFEVGDAVYYKRQGHDRWLGPGRVLCQDRKVVFVRHGGTFIRASPNRLIKVQSPQTTQPEVRSEESDVKENGGDVESRDVNQKNPVITEEIEKENPTVPDEVEVMDGVQIDWTAAEVEALDDEQIDGAADAAPVHADNREQVDEVNDGPRRSQRLHQKDVKSGVCTGCAVYVSFLTKQQQESQECQDAKQLELKKLKDFNTYEEVPYIGQKCITTRWVLTLKNGAPRARLVARGFEDKEWTQCDSPTVGKSAVRLFLTIAVSENWTVKTTDIKSAFLQGEPLERDVFIMPPNEANIQEGHVWKLRTCLYGLSDASRQFYLSVCAEMKRLGCRQSAIEPSLFYKRDVNGKLNGILVSHIDDFLHAGDATFDEKVMGPLRDRFLAGKLEEKDFSYVGFQIQQKEDIIKLDQTDYVETVELNKMQVEKFSNDHKDEALVSKELTMYRSLLGSINWIVRGSRPDMAYDLIELSIRNNSAKVQDLIHARKVMRRLKENDSYLIFSNLGDPSHWKMYIFTDASLGNLSDGVSSTMGIVLFLVGNGKACAIVWRANKIKRVVRSTLAAESLALLEGLEEALYTRAILRELYLKLKCPIIAYVDNKSLVEAVHSTKQVSDRRLRIDIGSIKQMMEGEIEEIRWCPGKLQLANCLTKKGASGYELLAVFHEGKIVLDI